MSAVLNAILENNEVADLYFETATTEDSENVIGWTLYGMINDRIYLFCIVIYSAIFQKHIGNETNAQITLAKAEKLQRAILKAEEDHAAAVAQMTSPSSDEKHDEEDKERIAGDEKGLIFHS